MPHFTCINLSSDKLTTIARLLDDFERDMKRRSSCLANPVNILMPLAQWA
jgi:hypothetical protein